MAEAESTDRRNDSNVFTGHTQAAVQAGTIAGGVHLHPHAAGDLPVPHQLPPDVAHFTGRRTEQGALDGLLDVDTVGGSAAVVISALAGSAGIGKTSLAVHWAHQVRHRFPDGQLYVNLRGFDLDLPLSPEQALDGFLRALNVPPHAIPADRDNLAATYRSLLAGRRMLIVLDNASTPEQVRPLLPGSATCLVIVTSRNRLSGLIARDGADRISLDVLPAVDALTLLREVIGPDRVDSEPDAAVELARRCAYLPLALRIAAERVADRPHHSIADLVDELASEHGRLDVLAADDDETTAIRSVFSWSYRALPASAARLFRLLGLYPGPDISLDTIIALTGITMADVRRQADTLVSMHMLAEGEPLRFSCHDLLREYANERAHIEEPAQERQKATRRLYEWYLHTAHAAQCAFYPQHPLIPIDPIAPDCRPLDFTSREGALKWFVAEHANLLAIISRAPTDGQYAVGWQLPNAVDAYLAARYRFADRVKVHQLGLATALHVGSQLGAAWANGYLAESYIDTQRYDDAMGYLQSQLKVAREIDYSFGEGCALVDLARVYVELGQYQRVADHAQRALGIFRNIGHPRNEALCLSHLGNASRKTGDFEQAMAYLRQALDISADIKDLGVQGIALRYMSTVQREVGLFEDAVTSLGRAATMWRQYGASYAQGEVLVELGTVLNDMSRNDEARDVWQEALVILEDIGHPQANEVRKRLDTLDQDHPG